MKSKRWDLLLFCFIFTAIGAWGGRMATLRSNEKTDAHEDDAAAPHGDELSPQTLSNLGVTLGVAEATTFTKTRAIPGVIETTQFTELPIFAPIGGRITRIAVRPGVMVKAGDTLLTMLRDPISRTKLTLTEEVIKPAREKVHGTVVELRKALGEVKILKTEIKRISKFTTGGSGNVAAVLPRQKLIELQYDLTRRENDRDQAEHELIKHGFTPEQIKSIIAGDYIPKLGRENWMRALVENGLWTEPAKRLFEALPNRLQQDRWTIATVGELAAAGLIHPVLISWVKQQDPKGLPFLEIGALIQMGYSVEQVAELHRQRALDPVISIRAPANGLVPDWDVHDIFAKPGAQVKAGDKLLSLLNSRELFLKSQPVGGEKQDILKSLVAGTPCDARPLVADAGPNLSQLSIDYVASDDGMKGTVAFVRVKNETLAIRQDARGMSYRSWKLRPGLKYLLQVPNVQLKNVFVIPSEAVADDGPAKVVFIPDGDTFKPLEVEIVFQDERIAVIAINRHTKVFDGDTIVMSGAYSLGMALKSDSAPVDAHAGHSH
ncbi:MAG: hypothetical protein V3W41_08320 [Planctomycetota bacterium]